MWMSRCVGFQAWTRDHCSKVRGSMLQVMLLTLGMQEGVGWTPLMIASSVKDGDAIVDLLLKRGADVNARSKFGNYAMCFDGADLLLG